MSVTETFTSTTTWTCPAGIFFVDAECWGGGGSGGLTETIGKVTGGGGGAYSKKNAIAVTPGVVYDVHVSPGAVAASGLHATFIQGNTADDSWFKDNTTVLAKGGNGGGARTSVNNGDPQPGGQGGQASSGIGDVKHSGGNGGDTPSPIGDYLTGAGGGAGSSADGTNCAFNTTTGGAGGSPDGGQGGYQNSTKDGATLGGGGEGYYSGGTSTQILYSGAGARGQIILHHIQPYFMPVSVGVFILTGFQIFQHLFAHFATGVFNLTGFNLTKHTIWGGQSKNTSTFTNQSKNSSTWTNETRPHTTIYY